MLCFVVEHRCTVFKLGGMWRDAVAFLWNIVACYSFLKGSRWMDVVGCFNIVTCHKYASIAMYYWLGGLMVGI